MLIFVGLRKISEIHTYKHLDIDVQEPLHIPEFQALLYSGKTIPYRDTY